MPEKSNGGDPSVPDLGSIPANYNEPASHPPHDRLPPGDVAEPPTTSPVGLRIRVEELLHRREPAPDHTWRELGPNARTLLVVLLDDPVIAQHGALRQRAVATTAQLGVTEAVPRLREMLVDGSESSLTRTYAANAIGRRLRADPSPAVAEAAAEQIRARGLDAGPEPAPDNRPYNVPPAPELID